MLIEHSITEPHLKKQTRIRNFSYRDPTKFKYITMKPEVSLPQKEGFRFDREDPHKNVVKFKKPGTKKIKLLMRLHDK